MKILKILLKSELASMFCNWKLVIHAVLLFLSILLAIEGIQNHKVRVDNQSAFTKVEKERLNKYIDQTQYAAYGIRVLLASNPFRILSGAYMDELTAKIDVSERLPIYTSKKGMSLTTDAEFINFLKYIEIIGILIALLYGFELSFFTQFEQLKTSLYKAPVVLLSSYMIRIVLINLIFIIHLALAYLIGIIFGIDAGLLSVVVIIVPLFFLLTMCFVVGVLVGTLDGLFNRVIWMTITAIIIYFMIPMAIQKIINVRTYSIEKHFNNYLVEYSKLTIQKQHEDRFLKEVGKYTEGKEITRTIIRLIKRFENVDNLKITGLELKLRRNIHEGIKFQHKLMSLFPPTFYSMMSIELGGGGLVGYEKFYDFAIDKKDKFLKLYLKNKYYSPSNRIETVLDSNVIAFDAIPWDVFSFGLVVGSMQIILLSIITYLKLNKRLFPFVNSREFEAVDMALKYKKSISVHSDGKFTIYLLNVLFGRKGRFEGDIRIEGVSIIDNTQENFFYLPRPDLLPGSISVQSLINLVSGLSGNKEPTINYIDYHKKHISDLSHFQKIQLTLYIALISKRSIIVFDNLVVMHDLSSITDSQIRIIADTITQIKNYGSSVIMLYSGSFHFPSTEDSITFEKQNGKYKRVEI